MEDRLVVASGKFRAWNLGSGKEQFPFMGGALTSVLDLSTSPSGKVFAAGWFDRGIGLWKAHSFITKGAGGRSQEWTFLATSTERCVTDDPYTVLNGYLGAVLCLAFSPDDRLIAIGTGLDPLFPNIVSEQECAAAMVWDVASGKMLLRLKGHQRSVRGVAFCYGGRVLLTGGDDGGMRIWNPITGEANGCLGGSSQIRSLGVSPDGKTVASGGNDGCVRVWELASGNERGHFNGHSGPVNSVCFSRDGRRLLTASDDGTSIIWDVTRGGLLKVRRGAVLTTLDRCWNELGSDDASTADCAMWALVAERDVTNAFLARKLRPTVAPDSARISTLVGELNSNEFVRRDKAFKELKELGDLVHYQLRIRLQGPVSLEEKARLERVLSDSFFVRSKERLRELRAIEVLERIGTKEAGALLERLGEGEPRARMTLEAREAYLRLSRIRYETRSDETRRDAK